MSPRYEGLTPATSWPPSEREAPHRQAIPGSGFGKVCGELEEVAKLPPAHGEDLAEDHDPGPDGRRAVA